MNAPFRTLACLMLLVGIASDARADQVASRRDPGSRTLITAQELAASQGSNLYDFVRMHRPMWLKTRGVTGPGAAPVMVYLDGLRLGDSSELRRISAMMVSELRYVDGREATTRWGSGHGSGAIVVSTAPTVASSVRAAAETPAG